MTSALSFANTIHTNTHSHSPRQDDEDALSNHQDQPPQLASQEIACFHKEPYALAPPGVAPLLGMQQQLEASQRPMTAALRLLLLVLLLVLPLTEAFVRLPLAPQRLFSQTRYVRRFVGHGSLVIQWPIPCTDLVPCIYTHI